MGESNAPRAVIDTNLFVSGMINRRGRPRQLLQVWYEDRLELVLSDWQHAELTDVFGRPKFDRQFGLTPQDIEDLFARINLTDRVIPSTHVPFPMRDPDDEHILAAAIGGNADYLVTGDNDLLVHQGDPRPGTLKIVTPAQFLTAFEGPPADIGAS